MLTSKEFAGKVAVVTGAGSGIGRALALNLAYNGASVVCADLRGAAAAETVAQIERDGGAAIAAVGDVSEQDFSLRTVASASETFGGLDVLANVAGAGHRVAFAEETLTNWRRVFAVNVDAAFLLSQAAYPSLRARGGCILNVASIAGLRPRPQAAAYSASKAALIALTRSLALEWSPAVRVNCICPGPIETPFLRQPVPMSGGDAAELARRANPLQRVGTPEEVAKLCEFICGHSGAFINGETIAIDGGASL